MKNFTQILIILLILTSVSSTSYSMTYQTITNGDWTSNTTWSTDGGISCCNCTPPTPSNGHDISVYHNINLDADIEISNSSTLLLYYGRSIVGITKNITITSGGYALFLSHVSINKLINGNPDGTGGGTIDIHHTFEVNGRVDLFAGTVNAIGGYFYMPNGNFNVGMNASFITSVGTKLELFSGNINNYGYIFICQDCCLESIGNWTNNSTGTVSGSGSALTLSGNMTNDNTPPSFSSDITWCTNGNDFGMPPNEDCATSTLTCGITVLPIELSIFEGVNDGEKNILNWKTETEKNTDYFKIQKSLDGYNWNELGIINGAGSSLNTNNYHFIDNEVAPISYYRLAQVDLNGEIVLSNPISISSVKHIKELRIYPNPIKSGQTAHITGLKKGDNLTITDNNGRLIMEQSIEIKNMSIHNLDISSFNSGIYLINITRNNDRIERSKLIVQ